MLQVLDGIPGTHVKKKSRKRYVKMTSSFEL